MHIIYLLPRSGYVTELRSDTLWGSICWGIKHLWGDDELKKVLDSYISGATPEFVISSAFPFKFQNGKRIPFFPNPLKNISKSINVQNDVNSILDEHRLRKKLKGIQYLSFEDFQNTLQGTLNPEELLSRIQEEYENKTKFDKIPNRTDEYEPLPTTIINAPPELIENSVMTHNTIDRLNGGTLGLAVEGEDEKAGQLFHAEEQYWRSKYGAKEDELKNGIFFLVKGNTDKVLAALRLLRDWGIGADRTTGKGSFDFEIEDFSLNEPDIKSSNAVMNLSLFHPTEAELISLKGIQYQLEPREGYVGFTRERRIKQPRMYFKEGSVFELPTSYSSNSIMGCIREQKFDDLHRPPHPVWDNGMGFMVNLKWNQQ
jgi:CRISPR-associated protein Csm4